MPSVFGENQTDYYFDSNADGEGNGTVDNPYKEFSNDKISDNATIHFNNGNYSFSESCDYSNISFYGKIANETVLNGNGKILTILNYTNFKNITLNNFKIINKANLTATNIIFANSDDSVIYALDNQSTYLQNCTFINNSASYGGSINVVGGNLSIENSIFLNNTANSFGGVILSEHTNIRVNNTRFYNNIAKSDAGGVFYVVYSNLTLNNISIYNSSATFGSAITSLISNLNITNSTFSNNHASYDGGSIYQMYGQLFISQSKFINNTALNGGSLFIDATNPVIISSSEFINNTALHNAGAIYSILVNDTLEDINFINNNADEYNNVLNTTHVSLIFSNGNYSRYVNNQTFNSTIPEYYNLNDYGFVTPVKNQAEGGNCWAFAALSALESCVLKASGEVLDLSEENMKNLMALFSDYGYNNRFPNDGGNSNMAVGYLTSWIGPVFESEDEYNDKSFLSPILNSTLHVQNVIFLNRNNYTDNDAIKQAIMQYGAVSTSMFYDKAYYNSENKVYHYYTGEKPSNHAVTIVGWDDSFEIPKANGTGAWIVKNSWGSNWANDGYFYVSYYDTQFAALNSFSSFTFILNDTEKFDKNYQYDPSGHTDYFFVLNSTVWYKNYFNATDNEFLNAVSTYFDKNTNWTVCVVVNDKLQITQNGTSNPGYYTINLDYPVSLTKGDVFEVIFKITADGDVGFPIAEAMSLNKMTYLPNISYMSLDGQKWTDLYNYSWRYYDSHWYESQVACIKAFTQFNTFNSTFRNLTITYDSFDLFNITAILLDENSNPISNVNVTIEVNGVNYTSEVYLGVVNFQSSLIVGVNNISIDFTSPNYYSAFINTTFDVEAVNLDLNISLSQVFNNALVNFTLSQKVNETLIINNVSYNVVDGFYQLNLSDLEYGNHEINATLKSDFYKASNSTTFFCNVKKTYIGAENSTIVFASNEYYIITLFDELGDVLSNYKLDYILNNTSYSTFTNDDGKVLIPVNLSVGVYRFEISFAGDELHHKSQNQSTITFIPANTTIVIDEIVYDSFDLFNITAHLFDENSNPLNNVNVTIEVNGVNFTSEVYLGVVNFQSSLIVGVNNISIDFSSPNYYSAFINTTFDVEAVNLDLNVSILQDFNNALVNFTLSQKVNETLVINNVYYNVVDGFYQLNLSDLAYGNHEINATLKSDFYKASKSFNIFCNVKKTFIEVNNLSTIYNSGDLLYVNLKDEFNQSLLNCEVKLQINNITYINTTDENGIAVFSIKLADGIYQAHINFDGDESHIKSQNNCLINVSTSIILPINNIYTLNSNYEVYFINKNGNPLNKTIVTFFINNIQYFASTDSEGKAILSVPVNSGNAIVKIINPETNETKYQNITILKRIINNKDLTMFYGAKNNYKIRVISDYGVYVSGLQVTFKINGKTYITSTDSKGYAYITIKNYKVGKYTVNAEYRGFKVSNKVIVKSTLTAKNIKIKKGKTIKFSAKLVNSKGKILKGKVLKFKFKGKTYKSKTNKKGIATIKIKNIYSKGKYKIYTSYSKLKITNTIVIKK